MGVRPLEEELIQRVSLGVLNKVYLALAKFNGMLNGPDASQAMPYNIWGSYHHIYNVIDGNRYITRYKTLTGKNAESKKTVSQQVRGS
jgi:hypothetical protein